MPKRKPNPNAIHWNLLPKQADFLEADARELLYSGAFGAGKSRSLCMKLVMRASKPGAREGLCRKWLATLRASTLKTLLEPEGDLPPVLPAGAYTWNKSERVINIIGGGQIYYFGLDDPGKVGSLNLSGCGIDEAFELEETDYTMLRGRCRLKLAGLTNQLYGATNPAEPSHHLAQRFGLAAGTTAKPNCMAIRTRSVDNWHLPDAYLADLLTFQGVARARYVEGEWVGAEGLIFDRWDRTTMVRHRAGPWRTVVVGQDHGYSNPAAMLVVCQDEAGRIHVAHEFYKAKQLEPQIIEAAERIKAEYTPEAFIVDPSAAALRATMASAGLPVREADNDVFAGINKVQKYIVMDGGEPRLTVDPTCTNLIRELETYEWMPGKDKPVKSNDHAVDALRYAIMQLSEAELSGGFHFRVIDPNGESVATSEDPNVWQTVVDTNEETLTEQLADRQYYRPIPQIRLPGSAGRARLGN